METPEYICSICRSELSEDECNYFEDEIYCDDCLDDDTFICQQCNERFSNGDNAGDDDTPLCESCYMYHYTNCEHCGRVLHRDYAYYVEIDDDDVTYCYSCHEDYERNSCIHPYSYKPDPLFYGNGERYLGVELEIDNGGKSERNAREFCSLANGGKQHIYIKTDGSLNDGLEIVTHPMSLEYHMAEMPWKSILEEAAYLGYTSHLSDTCGLHVHVNRSCFSLNPRRQDECIARILYIVERFWEELLRFSRRSELQMKRWATRYGYKEQPSDILDCAKNGHQNRYTCVNLINSTTIEFRFFRGTLKYNTLIATLQLVNEICDVAFLFSDEDIAKLGWPDFIERIGAEKYPELVTYLKERRIYINEIIQYEAEV